MAEVVYKAQFDINVNKTGAGGTGKKDTDKQTDTEKMKTSFNVSTKKILVGNPGVVLSSLALYAGKRVASTLISNIGLSTGNQYMQEAIQFGGGLAVGLISSVVGGAVAGSVIPGIGNLAGAIAGLGSWALSTGLDWASANYSAGIQKSIDRLNIGQINLVSGLGSSSFGRYSGSGDLY